MKKILYIAMMLVAGVTSMNAQQQVTKAQQHVARIEFDKEIHDFGKFPETDGNKTCIFSFTNTGDAPLIINQAVASCGCTVPSYTKTPIAPGEKGEIKVTYNGKRQFPGHFKKTITVTTNGVPEAKRLAIEGIMTAEE